MEAKLPLYTIGHGARKAEDFLRLLQLYNIHYLVDVRSMPFSRFHPQFSRSSLENFLNENQIHYVFMGDELGGRPKDPSCYNENGRIDYSIVSQKDYFKKGIERLRIAYDKNISLAFMCSERNPADCHRSRLISPALEELGILVRHIDEKGGLKDQETVTKEIKRKSKGKRSFWPVNYLNDWLNPMVMA